MIERNPDDWSKAWAAKTITSFGEMFPNNYDGSFLDFWEKTISNDCDIIVDLACGNGALTWLCNDIISSRNLDTRILGVDFSHITPFKVLQRKKTDYPRITFIGNTPIETLPFDDKSVDFAVSQYGIEYSNIEQTIHELNRVLKDDGKMAFIMHEVNSAILESVNLQYKICSQVFYDIKLHDLAYELAEHHEKDKNINRLQATSHYQESMAKIAKASADVHSILLKNGNPQDIKLYIDSLNSAFQKPKNKKIKLNRKEIITSAKDTLLHYIKRVEDLQSAARTTNDFESLATLVESLGFKVLENKPIEYNDAGVFGQVFVAERITAG